MNQACLCNDTTRNKFSNISASVVFKKFLACFVKWRTQKSRSLLGVSLFWPTGRILLDWVFYILKANCSKSQQNKSNKNTTTSWGTLHVCSLAFASHGNSIPSWSLKPGVATVCFTLGLESVLEVHHQEKHLQCRLGHQIETENKWAPTDTNQLTCNISVNLNSIIGINITSTLTFPEVMYKKTEAKNSQQGQHTALEL